MQKLKENGYFYALLAILFWSTVATAFKVTLQQLTALGLLFFSSLSASLFLAIYSFLAKGKQAFESFGKNIVQSLISGILNPFIYYLMLFFAYDRLAAQQAQVLNYTWAIMLPLFSMIFFKEKFRRKDFFALLFSFWGVILIATQGRFAQMKIDDPLGVAVAISTSLIWASYWILNLKDQREPYLRLMYNFIVGTVCILIYSSIAHFAAAKNWFLAGSNIWLGTLGALYVGIFEMGLTFVIWNLALQKAKSTAVVSNLIFITPFVSLIFIIFFLAEAIHPATVLGLLIILASNWLQKR